MDMATKRENEDIAVIKSTLGDIRQDMRDLAKSVEKCADNTTNARLDIKALNAWKESHDIRHEELGNAIAQKPGAQQSAIVGALSGLTAAILGLIAYLRQFGG